MDAREKLMDEFLAKRWEFQIVVDLLKQTDDEKFKI